MDSRMDSGSAGMVGSLLTKIGSVHETAAGHRMRTTAGDHFFCNAAARAFKSAISSALRLAALAALTSAGWGLVIWLTSVATTVVWSWFIVCWFDTAFWFARLMLAM